MPHEQSEDIETHLFFSAVDKDRTDNFFRWFVVLFFSSYMIFTAFYISFFRYSLLYPHYYHLIYYVIIGVSTVCSCSIGAQSSRLSERWTGSLRVALFLFTIAAPLCLTFLRVGTTIALLGMASVCAVVLVLTLRPPIPRNFVLLSIPAAAIFAAYSFLTINALRYATALSPENILVGLLHKDTLYHAAIASIFRNFGVPSTGLDGIPLTHYYVFSHIWLGGIADGVGLNAIFGYFLGNQIIFVPLMYFSVTLATCALMTYRESISSNIYIVAIPIILLLAIGIFDSNSYLVSESHAIGLVFLLIGLVFLVSIAKDIEKPISLPMLALGCLIGLFATASKISAGGVFLVAFYYILLRSGNLKFTHYLIMVLFGFFMLWLLQALLSPSAHVEQSKLNIFHFIRTYPLVGIANLVPVLVATATTAWQWRRNYNRPLQELLLVMLAVSSVPALFLEVDGGSAYYFINIGTWIAVAIIAARVIDYGTIRFRGANISRYGLLYCMIAASLFMIADLSKRHTLSKFSASISLLVETTATLPTSSPGKTIADNLKNSALGRVLNTIENYRDQDHAAIVMIEPSLWKTFPYKCPLAPFVVPAYTGQPLLFGLQEQAINCSLGPYYSFPDYGPQSPPKTNMSDREACVAAQARGFATLLRVETLDSARLLKCE